MEIAGISISIPEGALEEDSVDLLIHPCFSGPFELPAGYKPASPAYLIETSRRVIIQKNVTIKMNHYADLKSQEDCEEMVFLSSSAYPTPHDTRTTYQFKKIDGFRSCFMPKKQVGEIELQHFCFIKIARWVRERLDPLDMDDEPRQCKGTYAI